ncbi:ethanolamine utilization protein EutJ [Synergistales bacterium]|nr:ethanolamine utilization protein EutJ [Synergistales bacterium]
MRKFLVVVGIIAVFLCSGAFAADEVRIGIVLPISGQAAMYGAYCKTGIELALKELAPDNTITVGGKKLPLTIIYEDNENKPEITANAYRKLIDQDEVTAIIGPESSSTALAGAPIAQSSGIPVVTIFPTNPKVTQVGDYIFRACFIDPFQGAVMAKYAYNDLKVTKAAVLYNNGNDFSKGLTEFFTKTFAELGGKVVITEAYGGSDIRDFNAQFNNIKASDAQVLFMPNTYFESGLQMQQARSAGITLPLIGGDGWDTPDLVTISNGSEEGAAYSCAFSHEATTPQAQKFVQAYRAAYNDVPNSNAVLSYESLSIVYRAIEAAGSLDGAAIRDAIAKTKLELPSGVIEFDSDRNPKKPAVIVMYKGGKTSYVTTVNP